MDSVIQYVMTLYTNAIAVCAVECAVLVEVSLSELNVMPNNGHSAVDILYVTYIINARSPEQISYNWRVSLTLIFLLPEKKNHTAYY